MDQSIIFDRAVDYYDETRGFPPGVEYEAVSTLMHAGNLDSSSRVLEIGVGTGRIALPLAKRIAETYGLDLSRAMMNRLLAKRKNEPIYLVQGDATHLPYPNQTFDATVAVHIFHLIPDWQSAIGELARVLKTQAPIIHCWTENDDMYKRLWDAWNTAVPADEAADVGLRFDRNDGVIEKLGWRVGKVEICPYYFERSPSIFISQLENRIWSRTWRLSDDSISKGIAAVKAAVANYYSHPDQPIKIKGRFMAKTYYRA